MEGKKKILFIINPISGVSTPFRKNILDQINNKINREIYDHQIVFTEKAGHACKLTINAIKEGYKIIVAVGGDGSINEIARVITGTDVTLGILPTGSGNGLAHHLSIPINISRAIEVINKCRTIKIDTANINDLFFLSIAGIGFDATVAQKYAQEKRRGFLSYFKIITLEYPRYKPKKYTLTIDGKKIKTRALFISFANSDQFGYKTTIAPDAKINDGFIDVCLVKKMPLIATPFLAPLIFLKKANRSKYIKIIKAKEVKLTMRKGKKINLDGESVDVSRKIKLKVNPLSLKVIVP
ncbi:diacylglycerol/lipid kinase family protein [Bacteroidota bacterium]